MLLAEGLSHLGILSHRLAVQGPELRPTLGFDIDQARVEELQCGSEAATPALPFMPAAAPASQNRPFQPVRPARALKTNHGMWMLDTASSAKPLGRLNDPHFNMQSRGCRHVYECIQAEQIDLAPHQIGNTRLRHAE